MEGGEDTRSDGQRHNLRKRIVYTTGCEMEEQMWELMLWKLSRQIMRNLKVLRIMDILDQRQGNHSGELQQSQDDKNWNRALTERTEKIKWISETFRRVNRIQTKIRGWLKRIKLYNLGNKVNDSTTNQNKHKNRISSFWGEWGGFNLGICLIYGSFAKLNTVNFKGN